MVLQDRLVAVADGLSVAHRQKEGVVDTRVRHIADHAGEEARHDVQVGQELHETANFDEVVEVAGNLDNTRHVVVRILRVRRFLNCVYQVQEVAVGNGELF